MAVGSSSRVLPLKGRRTLFSIDEYGYEKEVSNWEESEDLEKIPVRTCELDEKEVKRLARILWEAQQEDNLKYSYDREGVFLITFDGYYDNEKKHGGGYGAMLWSGGKHGEPIVAVAGRSPHRVSTFYHNLEGLLSGLVLANNLPHIKSVFLVCNSERVCSAVSDCFITYKEKHCRRHPCEVCKPFCVSCLQGKLSKGELLQPVVEIMQSIMEKGIPYYRRSPWIVAHKKEWNRPAAFLAKMWTMPSHGCKRIRHHEFPHALEALVSEFGGQSPFIIQ